MQVVEVFAEDGGADAGTPMTPTAGFTPGTTGGGGCDCRTSGTEPPVEGAASAAAMVVLALIRRRKRLLTRNPVLGAAEGTTSGRPT
jgi:MYXO-CTERM domain-containing protein